MAIPISIHINIVPGRKKYDCTRFGICDISIDISIGERIKATLDPECDKLEIEFIERSRKYGCVMFVDQEIELPKEAANILGYDNITILRGEYKMDYYRSAWGKTKVMIKVGKPVEIPVQEC